MNGLDISLEDGEILLTGRGALLMTLLSEDADGKRVRLCKEMFAEKLLFNGMTLNDLSNYLGNVRMLTRSSRALNQVINYVCGLCKTPEAARPFVEWIYSKKFWSDSDVWWMLNEVARR